MLLYVQITEKYWIPWSLIRTDDLQMCRTFHGLEFMWHQTPVIDI